jgi:hypothetical protein
LKRWLALCFLGVGLIACGDDDDRTPEEALNEDLDGLEDAFNDGDAGRIYDDFMALECREGLSRDEAVDRFEAQAAGASVEIDEPVQVEIEEERAVVRAVMTAEAEEESKEAVDSFELVFEDGHWRFVDCFGGAG